LDNPEIGAELLAGTKSFLLYFCRQEFGPIHCLVEWEMEELPLGVR